MKARGKLLAAVVLAAVGIAGLPGGRATAEEGDLLGGTLKTIRDRGTILIGYRDNAVPFAFLNKGGQPVGFSVDLCRGIASDAAKALNRDLLEPDAPAWQAGIRMVFVPVAADARLPKIIAGEIDLECGSTTATLERQKSVSFSPVFFLAGTKLLAPIGPDGRTIASYRDLAGKTLAVATGTTTAEVVRRLAAATTPPIKVAEASGLDAAYTDLAGGKAEAFASDDVLLAGFVATRPDGRRFRLVGDFLSFEPYAIMLRRDDAAFATLVRQSFGRMAAEGMLGAAYNRWFTTLLPNGERLDLPMSPQLSEMYRALGQPD